eukprot:tig00021535_g22211.t1
MPTRALELEPEFVEAVAHGGRPGASPAPVAEAEADINREIELTIVPAAPKSTSVSFLDLPDEIIREKIATMLGAKGANMYLGSLCRHFRTIVKEHDQAWAQLCTTEFELGVTNMERAPRGGPHAAYFAFAAVRCKACFYGHRDWSPAADTPFIDPITKWPVCADCAAPYTSTANGVAIGHVISAISGESREASVKYGLYGTTIPHLAVDAAGFTNYAAIVRERERRRGLPARPGLLSMAEIVKRYRLVPGRCLHHRPRGALPVAGYDPETLGERFDPADVRGWLVEKAEIPDPERRVRDLEKKAERRKRKRQQEPDAERSAAPGASVEAHAEI